MALDRDLELEAEFLGAVRAEEAERPRSQQREIGPSEIGGCREYLRAKIAGDPEAPEPEGGEGGVTAAFVGTVGGDALEEIMGRRAGWLTQVPVETTLPASGLRVFGHADLVDPERDLVGDLKSKDGFAAVEYEGPSLSNMIQISIYVMGLVQQGVLESGKASAALVYWDRSGSDPTFRVARIPWEAVVQFVDLGEKRLFDVVRAQDALDAGDPSLRWALRDKPPSYCFSNKVLCPFREACWRGAAQRPEESKVISDEEIIKAVLTYKEMRGREKQAKKGRESAREALRGVTGRIPDGTSVGWKGGRIDVFG